MTQLSWYISDTRSLLRDQNAAWISDNQLIRWINTTRVTAAKITGCVRRLVTGQSAFGAGAQPGYMIPGAIQPGSLPDAFPAITTAGAATNALQTIPGVERYPFKGFFNPYLTAAYAGVKGIIDAASVSVSWGGASRPSLSWMAWEELQAYGRSYQTLQESFPIVWSVYNDGEDGEIWFFPVPSEPGDIEVDAYCVPSDLNNDDDVDAIPDGFQNAIKFGAADLAFQSTGRYAQSEVMRGQFMSALGIDRTATDRGKVPNWYAWDNL